MSSNLKKGQVVNIKVAYVKGDKMLVPASYRAEHEVKLFTILRLPQNNNLNYMMLIDEDIAGWRIGEFHVIFMGVEAKHLGKKFFDIDQDYIV